MSGADRMTGPGKCMWGGCGRPATQQIGLKIWAISTPRLLRNDGNCLKALTSVTVCDTCRPNVKASDFLLPEGRERIAMGLSRAGKAEPDFTSAQLAFEEIIDAPIDIEAEARASGQDIIES